MIRFFSNESTGAPLSRYILWILINLSGYPFTWECPLRTPLLSAFGLQCRYFGLYRKAFLRDPVCRSQLQSWRTECTANFKLLYGELSFVVFYLNMESSRLFFKPFLFWSRNWSSLPDQITAKVVYKSESEDEDVSKCCVDSSRFRKFDDGCRFPNPVQWAAEVRGHAQFTKFNHKTKLKNAADFDVATVLIPKTERTVWWTR